MKKIKEPFIFFILYVLSVILEIVIYLPSSAADSLRAFIGPVQYLKLFLSDVAFLKAVINTFRVPFISSFVLISFSFGLLKSKLEFSRKKFYICSFLTSFTISAIYFAFNVVLNNLLGYIIFPFQISLLCLIAFWVLELIRNIFKRIIEKGKMK